MGVAVFSSHSFSGSQIRKFHSRECLAASQPDQLWRGNNIKMNEQLLTLFAQAGCIKN